MVQEVVIGESRGYDAAVGPVAKILCALMKARKVGIKDLMRLTGMPRPTISRHKRGETEPDLEAREAYAKAFGIAPAEFEQMWQREQENGSNGISPEVVAAIEGAAEKRGLPVDDFVRRLLRSAPRRQAARRRARRGPKRRGLEQ